MRWELSGKRKDPREGNPARYNFLFYSTAIGVKFSMKKYMCLICGWIYDEAAGAPDDGIAPGTRWEDVPPNWTCPECGARKEDFEMIEL